MLRTYWKVEYIVNKGKNKGYSMPCFSPKYYSTPRARALYLEAKHYTKTAGYLKQFNNDKNLTLKLTLQVDKDKDLLHLKQ